jgi:amino-acid N-acetyltransferase
MLVRKALLPDASNVYDLVNSLSGDGTLLKRPFAEICENIRDFTVAESDGGIFLGCGALHLYGPHLSEVRSIVVKPEAKARARAGAFLVLIEEAEEHGIQSVCLFTRIPTSSSNMDLGRLKTRRLPDKIFKDCQMCPRLHRCDEVGEVRGRNRACRFCRGECATGAPVGIAIFPRPSRLRPVYELGNESQNRHREKRHH